MFLVILAAVCSTLVDSTLAHEEVSRNGIGRVSWKECNTDPGLRLDCGYYGVTEEKCYQRGCCWAEVHTPDTPWCYHSKLTTISKCMMDHAERIECGSYGVRKDQCLAQKCCWQPTNENGVPWCYHSFKPPLQGHCGIPAIPPRVATGRVVGGVEARPNSWPWQISLQSSGYHFCGASIINEYWLVSAAHCESSPDSTTAVAGLHSQSDITPSFVQNMEVERMFPHPDYGNELHADIMLIKLKEPIHFSEEVSPVCLPDQGEEFEAGTRCFVTGWGTTMYAGSSPDKLQQVGVPIIEQETCVEWYSDPQNWYYEGDVSRPVTDAMICAGYEEGGKGGCHGDSGGPFVCYRNDTWKLVGDVSWGGPCAYERTPTVYAKVSMFRNWIEEVFNEHMKK